MPPRGSSSSASYGSSSLLSGDSDRYTLNDTTADSAELNANSGVDDLKGSVDIHHEPEGTRCCSFRTFLSYAGPGWLMAIAYLDPGNIVSDLQAGAYTGYSLLWVLLLATAAGWLCQRLALSIGAITGRHLAEVCRENYPRPVAIILWLMAEVAIIGNDIQQIIGSAVAFRILFGIPLWAGSLITVADTFTFLFFQHFGIRKLEAFFATLVGTMSICFFFNFGRIAPPVADIAEGIFVPHVKSYAVLQLVGLLGAVIMPHNIYLHSASISARSFDRSTPAMKREAVKYFSLDAAVALFLSFLVNAAVIASFASGFFNPTCAKDGLAWVVDDEHPEGHCGEVGLFNAGSVLQGLIGGAAEYVWAIGILAAGQAATMTGTFAGEYVMQGFLDLKMKRWMRVLVTRATALIPSLAVTLVAQSSSGVEDVIDSWMNVVQSLQLPFALLPVLHFAASEAIMGEYKISGLTQAIMWLLTFLVIGVNVFLMATELPEAAGDFASTVPFYLIITVVGLFYALFLVYLMQDELRAVARYLHLCGSREATPLIAHGAGAGAGASDGMYFEAEEPLDGSVNYTRV